MPHSGRVRDSCGACGGNDTSCGLPYALQLAAPRLCLGQPAELRWTAPANRSGRHFVCIFRPGNLLPHQCLPVGPGGRGVSEWAPGSALGRLGGEEGAAVRWAWSAGCDEYALDAWTAGRCPAPAGTAPVIVGPPPDACGVCGGDNRSCVGCDGVAGSGARVDACGACGGGDDSCGGPYAVAAPAVACAEPGGGRGGGVLRVEAAWSGPSNHSAYDRVGLYGPDPAAGPGGLSLWSGRCAAAAGDGGGAAACDSDAGCPAGSACWRMEAVPAGSRVGSVTLVARVPAGAR